MNASEAYRRLPISRLSVPQRAQYAILKFGITTIGELEDLAVNRPGDMLRIPNLGRTTLEHLLKQMRQRRLSSETPLEIARLKRDALQASIDKLEAQLQKKRNEIAAVDQRLASLAGK